MKTQLHAEFETYIRDWLDGNAGNHSQWPDVSLDTESLAVEMAFAATCVFDAAVDAIAYSENEARLAAEAEAESIT